MTSAAAFATRQCDALTLARSIEKGVSAMCLSDSNAAIGHFATVANAISAPESCRSFEMVLASRYAWLKWV